MCGKVFYAMNIFGVAHFSLSVIDALKIHFKAIIYIHAAFINKIGVFSRIFIFSYMPLILYFSHIFTSSTVLEIISRLMFNLTVPFCLEHDNVVHR